MLLLVVPLVVPSRLPVSQVLWHIVQFQVENPIPMSHTVIPRRASYNKRGRAPSAASSTRVLLGRPNPSLPPPPCGSSSPPKLRSAAAPKAFQRRGGRQVPQGQAAQSRIRRLQGAWRTQLTQVGSGWRLTRREPHTQQPQRPPHWQPRSQRAQRIRCRWRDPWPRDAGGTPRQRSHEGKATRRRPLPPA